jgi:hypothetical protein
MLNKKDSLVVISCLAFLAVMLITSISVTVLAQGNQTTTGNSTLVKNNNMTGLKNQMKPCGSGKQQNEKCTPP